MCKSLETLSSCISSLSEYTVYSRYIFVKRSKKQGVSFLPHAAKHLKTLNDKKKKCLSLIFCFYLILIVVFPWDDDTVYLRNRNALLPPPLCRYKSSTVKHEEAIWERLLLLFSFVSGLSLQHSKPFFFFFWVFSTKAARFDVSVSVFTEFTRWKTSNLKVTSKLLCCFLFDNLCAFSDCFSTFVNHSVMVLLAL